MSCKSLESALAIAVATLAGVTACLLVAIYRTGEMLISALSHCVTENPAECRDWKVV